MNKKQIKKLVIEANQELLSERYPQYGDEQAAEIKQDITKFDKYSSQTYQLLQQLQRDIVADYEAGNVTEIQLEYIMTTVLPNISQQVQYTHQMLDAMKTQGVKHVDSRDFNPYEE